MQAKLVAFNDDRMSFLQFPDKSDAFPETERRHASGNNNMGRNAWANVRTSSDVEMRILVEIGVISREGRDDDL